MRRRKKEVRELFFLPKKYHEAHQFCFFIHDLLVETLSSSEKVNVFSRITFKPKKEDLEKLPTLKLEGEEFWNWLENNGYENIARLMTYKACIPALISDFCHFVYAALRCSEQGKITVALSVLRKPLKENLFYLEWLLSRPSEFLHFFAQGADEINDFISKVGRPSIIKESTKQIKHRLIDSELLYAIRYKKDSVFSFDPLWNKAIHLLTTFSAFKTENQNFNFIFSGDKEKLTQWQFMYSYLPFLLFHAVEIFDSLLAKFAIRKNAETDTTDVRRIAGYFLWFREFWWEDKQLRALLKELRIRCTSCQINRVWSLKNLKMFYEVNKVQCPRCKKTTVVRIPRGGDKRTSDE